MSEKLRYACLEPGCDSRIEADEEDELVAAVQAHMAERHDTFELEDVILDAARTIGEANRVQ